MEQARLKSILESLIFVSESPLKIPEMQEAIGALEDQANRAENPDIHIVDPDSPDSGEQHAVITLKGEVAEQLKAFAAQEDQRVSRVDIVQVLEELAEEYTRNPSRGIVLAEVAGGWQFRTRPENAVVIRQLYQAKPTKISKPSLETLAIVAYRQPITRVEIDEIRGVDSGGVLKTLLEKNLVKIVGKKEEPGRPMLYGTTQYFLELFQLKSLKDLPTLKEFRELEEAFHKQEGEEGVMVENVAEKEEGLSSLLASSSSFAESMDEEEGEIIEDLESSLKELRHVEQDIFSDDQKSELKGEGREAKGD